MLGRTNMFRYNNPAEAALMRKDNSRASRMDLSRLSWIAASRENLSNSFISEDDGSPIQHLLKAQRAYMPTEQTARDLDLQEEHKKILATIENALKQLNTERVQMHEQYKNKVRVFNDELERLDRMQHNSMTIVDCKIRELHARREMLLWEQSNERTQVSGL
jgi:kinesin family member 16B